MKILLTGLAGFVGFHTAKKLVQESNIEIIGLDNINEYYNPNLKYLRLEELGFERNQISSNQAIISSKHSQLSFVKADLENAQLMNHLYEKYQITHVIHLAAQAGVRYSLTNPATYVQSNLVGFLNILESCRKFKIQHLIYASSSSVYGLNKSIPFKETDTCDHPASLYAATKKSNELMAHSYSHLFGLPTTGLRFFTVYGPWGRPDMAYFIFTDKILKGAAIDVFNFGKMKRDLTYISDIVDGIVGLLDKPPQATSIQEHTSTNLQLGQSSAPYQVYNIGNNSPISIQELVSTIETLLNKKAQVNLMPIQPGDVESTYADIDKLAAITGFQPKTKLADGLKQFTDWYLKYQASL